LNAARSRSSRWAEPLVAGAAGAAGFVVVVGLLSLIMVISGSGHEHLARRAVVSVVAALAFVAPLLFACAGSVRNLGRLAAGMSGGAAALTLFSLAMDPGAAGGVLLAVVYVLSYSLFAFGLASAVGRAVSSRAAGRTLTVAVLLVAVTTTFTTGGLYEGLEGSPGAHSAAVRLSVGCNPFLMANRVLTVASRGGGSYIPKQGVILYDLWIGTDFAFGYPAWWQLAIRWAVLGTALWALAEWLPRRLSRGVAGADTVPEL